MRQAKIILAAGVAILTVIVVLQNTAPVETRLLFATVKMPRAALLFITLVVGFVLGLITASSIYWRKGKGKAER